MYHIVLAQGGLQVVPEPSHVQREACPFPFRCPAGGSEPHVFLLTIFRGALHLGLIRPEGTGEGPGSPRQLSSWAGGWLRLAPGRLGSLRPGSLLSAWFLLLVVSILSLHPPPPLSLDICPSAGAEGEGRSGGGLVFTREVFLPNLA